jgi:hypothetical protein
VNGVVRLEIFVTPYLLTQKSKTDQNSQKSGATISTAIARFLNSRDPRISIDS